MDSYAKYEMTRLEEMDSYSWRKLLANLEEIDSLAWTDLELS